MEKLKAELARKKAEAEALKQKAAALNASTASAPSSSSSTTQQQPTTGSKFIRQKDVLEAKQRELEEAQRKADEEKLLRKRQLEEKLAQESQERQQRANAMNAAIEAQAAAKKQRIEKAISSSADNKEGEESKGEGQEGKEGEQAEKNDSEAETTSDDDPNKPITDLYNPTKLLTKMNPPMNDAKIVHHFFQILLNQWKYDLEQRTPQEKLSSKGKADTHSYDNCEEYIQPLFRLCKTNSVPIDILHRVHLMVKYCEEGNFVKANDEYIKTAIGNAAWPIGLTMVGIHERSGRERISTAKIAHVMNNEMERKYLTSVKRLITFCQTKRPDVPPSMKVNI